jgi:hypothetical protein
MTAFGAERSFGSASLAPKDGGKPKFKLTDDSAPPPVAMPCSSP